MSRRAAAVAGAGGADAAVTRAAGIDEIEFELDREDGGEAVGGEAVDDAAEDMARIEIVRGAVEFVEIDEELRGLIAAPRRADERAGDRLHRAVGVAILPDQAGFDRVLPRDVAAGYRAGRSDERRGGKEGVR